MARLIKRYGSRKLYDTEESRYVLLEDIAGWIRAGEEVAIIDSATGDDVTAQTLTQVISEEGRRGTGALPSDLLHEIIRLGANAVNTGVRRLQDKVDRFVQSSIDRLAPVRQAREEMSALRQRLDELEASLSALDGRRGGDGATATRRRKVAEAKRPRPVRAARRRVER